MVHQQPGDRRISIPGLLVLPERGVNLRQLKYTKVGSHLDQRHLHHLPSGSPRLHQSERLLQKAGEHPESRHLDRPANHRLDRPRRRNSGRLYEYSDFKRILEPFLEVPLGQRVHPPSLNDTHHPNNPLFLEQVPHRDQRVLAHGPLHHHLHLLLLMDGEQVVLRND